MDYLTVENPGGSRMGDRKKVQIWTQKRVACGQTLLSNTKILNYVPNRRFLRQKPPTQEFCMVQVENRFSD